MPVRLPPPVVVDGVLVFPGEEPGPLRASLLCRSGVEDETFSTLGLSHLVGHLAMEGLGESGQDHDGAASPLEIGGGVRRATTELSLRGTPEQVAAGLERVCRAVADMAQGHVAEESLRRAARDLTAAGAVAEPDPCVAEHLRIRLGLTGAGLAAVPELFLPRITVQEVQAWAAERFTRGNAVLALSGPVPQGLRLCLPEGPRRSSPPPPVWRSGLGPREHDSENAIPTLSFHVPRAVADGEWDMRLLGAVGAVFHGVLQERVDGLGGERGAAQGVAASILPFTGDVDLAVVSVSAAPGEAVRAAREVRTIRVSTDPAAVE